MMKYSCEHIEHRNENQFILKYFSTQNIVNSVNLL